MSYVVRLVVLVLAVTLVPGVVLAGSVDPGLAEILLATPPGQAVPVLVFMEDRVDLERITSDLDSRRATLRLRHETVVVALHAMAEATQPGLLSQLEAMKSKGLVEDFRSYWIANCIWMVAQRDVIAEVAARPDVGTVYFDYEIESIKPVSKPVGESVGESVGEPGETDRGARAPEVGLVAVRAPEVWAMGYTGEGILVATLDTGVDGAHPALASRWRGVADPRYVNNPEWAWFDPVTNTTFPQSFGSHGTHTMGSVCGGAPGDEIGVAPGAQWIHAAVIDRVNIAQTVADAILSFEWMLDPDEDPSTNWDVPAVCSNSWRVTTGHGYPPCDETFWLYLDACHAAGIVILFSAGNEGSSPGTVGRPPDRATDGYRTCAVAAVDANSPSWPVAGFSSRGPSYCTPDGSAAIKPDISAPGVEVRSSVPGGGYQGSGWSGTSMASPHVNGVVALIRQICPFLTVEEVIQILYDTAFDLGSPGEDNSYGYGMVDAYEAALLADLMCGPRPPDAEDGDYETPVDTPVSVELIASDFDGEPDPPGAIHFEIISLPEPGNTLTDSGDGHVITPDDLPYELVNGGNVVLYSPASGYYGTDTFQFVADDGGAPPDEGDSEPATISVLVLYDPPAITTVSLPGGQIAAEYGPVQLEVADGQPELTWHVLGSVYQETDLGEPIFEWVGEAQNWNADNSSWSYTLPFAFPFYDQAYMTVWITSNGYLDFDGPSDDETNSDAELIAATRIAPLWDDLRTDQPDTDIFISAESQQVTIRWHSWTFYADRVCNHAVTLYDDGRILFQYGPGNDRVTPTVGISAGDGVNYLFSTQSSVPTLENANAHRFTAVPPMPDGITLSPSGVLSGTTTHSGTFNPRFLVADSLGRTDQRELALHIVCLEIGDVDGDGQVDLQDFALFPECNTGPVGPVDPPAYPPECRCTDADDDGDVDFADFANFQLSLSR